MRDPELMLALLREMAAEPSGEIFALQTYGMSKEQQQRRHHIDLLADIGQAQWTGRHALESRTQDTTTSTTSVRASDSIAGS